MVTVIVSVKDIELKCKRLTHYFHHNSLYFLCKVCHLEYFGSLLIEMYLCIFQPSLFSQDLTEYTFDEIR